MFEHQRNGHAAEHRPGLRLPELPTAEADRGGAAIGWRPNLQTTTRGVG